MAVIRLALTFLIAAGLTARAQATPSVPPEARVYRDVERLAALGLIDSLMIGGRPWSEREVVRLLTEARANLERNPAARAWAEPVIRSQLARYERTSNRVIDIARAEVAVLSSQPRPAPSDGNGRIDADINPLAANRGGRPLVDGLTFGVETSHSATLGRFLAGSFSPRAQVSLPRGAGDAFSDADVQRATVSVLLGDLGVSVGRDYATFGQSPTGGLMLSDNAPPLDMIRVWNDRAWRVPLISRILGGVKGTLLVADLGADRVLHPHTKLVGYHVAMLPHPQLELGFEVLDAMGGNGGQAATFGDRVLDVITIVDVLRTKSDFQFSNKLAGVDLHWRMPRWAGFELYAEGAADDFDGRNLSRGFLADASYIAGASLSCVVSCGRVGVRAEYHQTGIRYYTHGDYPLTTNGLLLGDPLGPRGLGGYLTVDASLASRGRIALSAAFEARSGNTYRSATTGPGEEGFHFELVSRRPSEKRARATASWTSDETRRFSVEVSGGLERVVNFAFAAVDSRTNGLMRVGVVGRP